MLILSRRFGVRGNCEQGTCVYGWHWKRKLRSAGVRVGGDVVWSGGVGVGRFRGGVATGAGRSAAPAGARVCRGGLVFVSGTGSAVGPDAGCGSVGAGSAVCAVRGVVGTGGGVVFRDGWE